MKRNLLVLSTGFALFSMFFGSGNLVFPIAVGQESSGQSLAASIGILLTGVVVPFLGVFGMLLYRGEISSFFSCFGKKGTFLFSLFALSLMGPFGVLARCLTVAHGALQLLYPDLTLPQASFVLCAAIYLLTVNKSKIVTVVGPILTPLLLISISGIAFFGLKDAHWNTETSVSAYEALKNGFFQGYQTMDLLAAFFFSSFILTFLKETSGSSSSEQGISFKVFTQSALVGASILSAVYVALVYLGGIYSRQLENVPPQEMLGRIAFEVLGPFAAPCICIALVLACMTTAIVLTSLFAEFLRVEVSKDKLGNRTSLLITLAIGFFVSTLEFSGIAKFIGPVLEAVYPALIVLTLVNIAHKVWGTTSSHWPVTATLAAKFWWV